MPENIPLNLERYSQCAIHLNRGRVQQLNQAAALLFPGLAPGGALPAVLSPALDPMDEAGSLLIGPHTYFYSRLPLPQGELLLLHSAPQTSLTQSQLDGFLRQLRQFMAEILLHFELLTNQMARGGGDLPRRAAAFQQSFHRLFRLLNNLDFLRAAGDEGVSFRPVTMDLAGLCAHLTQECAGLLSEGRCRLTYRSDCLSLLIPGDPGLLQRMLLGLISNAVKAAPRGEITLHLSSRGDRALLTLNDSGPTPTDSQMAALFQLPTQHLLPPPEEGAGLGMSIVRHIVALHGGSLLAQRREGTGLVCAISLPTGPLDGQMAVRSPRPQRDGGLSPLLVELSDVLPPSLFKPESLE